MAVIPTRHLRTSILDQMGLDYDKSELSKRLDEADNVRKLREAERAEAHQRELMGSLGNTAHKYSLEEIMANEHFKKMLESIASTRIGFARNPDLNKYGYAYDPTSGTWTAATWEDVQDGGELPGAPWYRTAREAINAVYDDALRGNHGENLAGFGLDDLYAQMNRLVDERAKSILDSSDDRDALLETFKKGKIYDDDGNVIPFKSHSPLYTFASTFLPMRTIGSSSFSPWAEPELQARSTMGEDLRNLGLDAGEAALSILNPWGKGLSMGVRAGTKLAGKGIPKIPTMVNKFIKGASDKVSDIYSKPWVQLAAEGGIGNLANYGTIHAADYGFDPENTTQGGEFNKTGALIAGLSGALPGVVGGMFDKMGKGRTLGASILLSPKEKARSIIAESLNLNNDQVDEALVKGLLAKNATWADFLKKPFRDIESEGYPFAGIAQVPRQSQKGGMLQGDRQMLLDDLKDVFPESRHGDIKDWMDMNPKEVQDLAGGSSYSRYNRDDAGVPGTTPESWDVFGVTADQSPQFYKSAFKVPLKNESETIEGLAKDEIERRMQRGDKLSKDYATRRKIHDMATGSNSVTWDAPIWSGKRNFVKNNQSINPGSAVIRRGLLGLTREAGIGDPHNNWGQHLGLGDPIYEQVRTRGVPTKNKEKK